MTVVTRSIPRQRLINLAIRTVLLSPLHARLDDEPLLLTVTGRRTGRRDTFPVGTSTSAGVCLMPTQHAWCANLRGAPTSTSLWRGRDRRLRADLDQDLRSVAENIDHLPATRRDARRVQRWLGPRIVGEIDVTTQELARDAVEFDLASITLAPAKPPRKDLR